MCAVMYSWIENYSEFQNLSNNADYYDIRFDWMSGGVSAIHKDHCFDKSIGPFGIKRGDYERYIVDVLRSNGHRIILLSEVSDDCERKSYDCLLDEVAGEIKTVEGDGLWAVRTKFYQAAKQNASYLILYFPDNQLYTYDRVIRGWRLFLSDPSVIAQNKQDTIQLTYVVTGGAVLEIEKPPG